jgi:hypothetical protein
MSNAMNRRSFLTRIAASAGVVLLPRSARSATTYPGPYYITVHCSGGWDPTLLCDPKGNTSADPASPITDYLESDIVQVGAFRVPPVDGHEAFFSRFHDDLLVINGVDAETVSHETGTRNTWSGSTGPDWPAFNALVAASASPAPSLGFLSYGGYDRTGGLIAPTRIPSASHLAELSHPWRVDEGDEDSDMFPPSIQDRIATARDQRLQRQRAAATLPRVARAQEMLAWARVDDNALKRLDEALPDDLDESTSLSSQAQIALAAFKAGISVSANLEIGGFDTHGDHDEDHREAMIDLVEGLTFLMDEAERQGLGGQVVLLVGSEFGRPPYYNDSGGKDHWSVTAMLAMGPGIRGGRVVGGTTEGLVARHVDPATLKAADEGVPITPSVIHGELRQLAGIDDDPLAVPWPVGEALGLFG